jgi:hypothetical protein
MIKEFIEYLMDRPSRRAYKKRWLRERTAKYITIAIALVFASLLIIASYVAHQEHMILESRIEAYGSKEQSIATQTSMFGEFLKTEVVETPPANADYWVGKYVDQYFELPGQQSEMRMIMHCLLNREAKHGYDQGHGDGGKAGGPLQFHNPTWIAYRKIMMEEGLVDELGSRYDMEQAIHTTVWAIHGGRAKAWGPILRASKGSTSHACTYPSFY